MPVIEVITSSTPFGGGKGNNILGDNVSKISLPHSVFTSILGFEQVTEPDEGVEPSSQEYKT